MRGREAVSRRTVRAHETLRVAARRMTAEGLTCLVALEAGTPRGVVTDRDLVLAALCGGLGPATPVAALAWRPLVTIVQGERPDEAVRLMEAHGLRHLPVAGKAGLIIGMVAVEDALALVLEYLTELAGLARTDPPMPLAGAVLRAEDTQRVLPTIDGAAPARALAALLKRTGADALFVLDSARPAGVVSERDLLSFVAGRRDADRVCARDLVRRPFAAVDPRDRLEQVVDLMASYGVDMVAVVRGTRTLGMVSLKGLLAGLAFELAERLTQAAAPACEATARSRPLLH